MAKKHLKQPGFTYSVCGSFTEAKETFTKVHSLKKQVIAYEDFKDLNRRTAADAVSCNKAFNIAKNP